MGAVAREKYHSLRWHVHHRAAGLDVICRSGSFSNRVSYEEENLRRRISQGLFLAASIRLDQKPSLSLGESFRNVIWPLVTVCVFASQLAPCRSSNDEAVSNLRRRSGYCAPRTRWFSSRSSTTTRPSSLCFAPNGCMDSLGRLAENVRKAEVLNLLGSNSSGFLSLLICRSCHYVFSNFYSNFWLIFGKRWEALYRLYRSRIFQLKLLKARLKALDEIYKIYTLLHRSAFKNSATFRQTFSHFYLL